MPGKKGELPAAGLVSIVGGGPGDPGLITVTGMQRLRGADVVVADRLAPLELLEELSPAAYIIDAAKVPGGPAMRQDHINHALVEHARAGRAVVRLKGGDPFVFGRGREELQACLTAGVPVEVVPGVTSAISVPAAAGIPVTHRGLSQGFCVLAGHVRPGDPRSSIDWAALARSGMTLVLLMAIDHLAAIAAALLAGGLGAETPCAAVSDGWTRRQRVITAPLRDLAAAVTRAGIANPAVIVIGEVARLASSGHGQPGSRCPAAPRGGPAPVGPAPTPAHGQSAPPAHETRSAAPVTGRFALPGDPAATQPTATRPAPTRPPPSPPPRDRHPPHHSRGRAPPTATASAPPPPSAGSAPPAPSGGRRQPTPPRHPACRPRHPLTAPHPGPGWRGSGKSAAAEDMLAGLWPVDYVATGTPPGWGDEEWDARVRRAPAAAARALADDRNAGVAEVLAAPDGATPRPLPPSWWTA